MQARVAVLSLSLGTVSALAIPVLLVVLSKVLLAFFLIRCGDTILIIS